MLPRGARTPAAALEHVLETIGGGGRGSGGGKGRAASRRRA
jgi:hypothetical protein